MTIPNNNQKPATLSDVAIVMPGNDTPQSQTYTEGVSYPVYQAGQTVGTVDTPSHNGPAIVIGNVGRINYDDVRIVDGGYGVSSSAVIIKPKPQSGVDVVTLSAYLALYLPTIRGKYTQGSIMGRVPIADIQSFPWFNIPPDLCDLYFQVRTLSDVHKQYAKTLDDLRYVLNNQLREIIAKN